MSDAYSQFLASKDHTFTGVGIGCTVDDVNPDLFEFQRHIVAWAVRKGCAAIWADTGLGKTRMQVEWARLLTEQGGRALILAPLAVAHQTIREADAIGVHVEYVRNAQEVTDSPSRIVICNYDRLDSLDPSAFTAVVLDESSILKAFSGVTKRALVESFKATPYRLSCSATPAPNDIEELCNHADFLGVMAPQEMRSTFFIADSRGQFMRYRLKGHAESAFYSWLASWAIACRTPSDLGFDDSGYILPPLHIEPHFVESGWTPEGELFTARLNGITERSQVRKATMNEKIRRTLEIVNADRRQATPLQPRVESGEQGICAGLQGADQGAPQSASPGTIRRGRSVPGEDEAGVTSNGIEARPHTEEIDAIQSGCDGVGASDGSRLRDLQSESTHGLNGEAPCGSRSLDGEVQGSPLSAMQSGARSSVRRSDQSDVDAPVPDGLRGQWLVWCGLNAEQDALAAAFGDDCVSIDGKTPLAEKIALEQRWRSGEVRVMLTKPKIFAWGINWQHCNQMLFVGLSDSYELFYQAIRRCYRFGQAREVHAHIVLADVEESIYLNVLDKEHTAKATSTGLIAAVASDNRAQLFKGTSKADNFEPTIPALIPSWLTGAAS